MRITHGILAALTLLVLTGCGSDDGSTTVSGTISGVAATGMAISGGTVTLKCAGGLGSVTGITRDDGYYEFDVRNVTLPCLVQVSHSDDTATTHTLHALVSNTGTTNITPLSELLLATLLGTPSLEPAFARFHHTALRPFSPNEQRDAMELIAARLHALGLTLPAGIDPVHAPLVARTDSQDGNALDAWLDELGSLVQANNINQFQLNLATLLNLPVGFTQNFLSPSESPTSVSLPDAMTGTHTGTLAETEVPCSFSVTSDGNMSADFSSPYRARSLHVQQRPSADGLVIQIGGPLNIPPFQVVVDGGYAPLQSAIWNFIDDGNGFGINAAEPGFFDMTGANGAALVSLRHIAQSDTPATGLATIHRELQVTVATSALSQPGSATCVTPAQTIPMTTP